MASDVVIRPLERGDVPAAAQAGNAALNPLTPAEFLPSDEAGWERLRRRSELRVEHIRRSDPEGSWVAELDGQIVAIALSIVREDVWGLSLLGVRTEHQGRGIGARVLAAALRYAAGRRGAIILSSTDPRAMRSYFRAGFRLRPAVAAAGPINRSRIPAGLRARPGDPDADRELLDDVSRHVRTAAHGDDIAAMLAGGTALLVLDGRGFAVHRDGSPALLAARDEEAATDLLWSCLAAGTPGAPAHFDFISERNDWAVAVALDAGMSLSPDGPVFVRGETGPFAPYLPSGAYL
jgi:GNAT superfamily N-acetyltransferase